MAEVEAPVGRQMIPQHRKSLTSGLGWQLRIGFRPGGITERGLRIALASASGSDLGCGPAQCWFCWRNAA